MPLREYITITDINNTLFNRFTETTRQLYVDMANEECEDLCRQKIGSSAVGDIADPIHYMVKRYLTNFAVQQLCIDKANSNSKDGQGGEDVYERAFKRMAYILQNIKPKITATMLIGVDDTPINRAVVSQRLWRG